MDCLFQSYIYESQRRLHLRQVRKIIAQLEFPLVRAIYEKILTNICAIGLGGWRGRCFDSVRVYIYIEAMS